MVNLGAASMGVDDTEKEFTGNWEGATVSSIYWLLLSITYPTNVQSECRVWMAILASIVVCFCFFRSIFPFVICARDNVHDEFEGGYLDQDGSIYVSGDYIISLD